MTSEAFVKLKITSVKYTHYDINLLIGITCDKSWYIGEYRKHTIIKEKYNAWILESTLPKCAKLDDHIINVLNRLDGCEEKIQCLPCECIVEFSCAIYAGYVPALYFDNKIINRLSNIGANFDVDLYII